MGNKPQSKGRCNFCGETFARSGMSKHLQTCKQRQAAIEAEAGEKQSVVHLQAAGTYAVDYWLHFEIPASATLKHLDQFLRDIWLECCGHMSAFEIAGERFYSGAARELGGKSFTVALSKVLKPGMEFSHEYDFGTTTDLTLKVIAVRDGMLSGRKRGVQILARNYPPPIMCDVCHQELAAQVCPVCVYEDKGWLCEKCAADHACGEDMLLPVVNSPRVGECGYTGPYKPEYA